MNQSNENHRRETEEILAESPLAQRDDDFLLFKVWRKFHAEDYRNFALAQTDDEMLAFYKKLPKPDSIKRYRRDKKMIEKYPRPKDVQEKNMKQFEESRHFYAANGQGMIFKPQYEI